MKSFTNHSFLKKIFVVATGTAFAQLITILFSPLLTRVYTPDALGVFGTFSAILTILTPIANLGYPYAIVIQENEKSVAATIALSIGLTFGFCLFLASTLFVSYPLISEIPNFQRFDNLVWITPLAVLISSSLVVANQIAIREEIFKAKATIYAASSLLVNLLKLLAGMLWPTPSVLIGSSMTGNSFNTLLLTKFIAPVSSQRIKFSAVIEVAKTRADFAIFRTPQILINVLSQSLPIVFLAASFGSSAAGYYTLSRSVLTMPVTLISGSLGEVLFPTLATAQRSGQRLFKKVLISTIALLLVGIVPFTFVFVFGPDLFDIVFGDKWRTAGEYGTWLSIWLFSVFICSPVNHVVPIIGEQRLALSFAILKSLARIAVLAICFKLGVADVYVVAYYSIASFTVNILYIFVILRLVYQYDAMYVR